jgi:hypothetical protein
MRTFQRGRVNWCKSGAAYTLHIAVFMRVKEVEKEREPKGNKEP